MGCSKAKHGQAAPAQSLSSRPQTNRTRYKLLCLDLSRPLTAGQALAGPSDVCLLSTILSCSAIGSLSAPDHPPRASSPRPHGCFGGVSRVRAASPHPIFSLVLPRPVSTREQPFQPWDSTALGGGRAGRQGRQAGLDWSGRDSTWKREKQHDPHGHNLKLTLTVAFSNNRPSSSSTNRFPSCRMLAF